MSRAVMQQALEALELSLSGEPIGSLEREAITALRAALAEPEQPTCKESLQVQEPVARAWQEGYNQGVQDERISEASIGIVGFGAKVEPARQNPYRLTAPTPRKPVELTESEIAHAAASSKACVSVAHGERVAFARAVIAAYEAKQGEQT